MSSRRLLITSGPTREYIDPVRFLSNGSSGKMGSCLADAAIRAGWDVTIITGPVHVEYPERATLVEVVSTAEMLQQVLAHWPECHGMIAAAAPSDFRPLKYSSSKLKKSAATNFTTIELIENPDILAEVGKRKRDSQWTVGFALETENGIENAKRKLKKKRCDYIVLNDPSAIDASSLGVTIINGKCEIVLERQGTKDEIADQIVSLVSV